MGRRRKRAIKECKKEKERKRKNLTTKCKGSKK